MTLSTAALSLLVTATAAAAPPPVVHRAAVSWADADWPAEMGSLPLGNGDVSANAWVERESGNLLIYLAKSDAFDINALPIKVGRLRLAFDPPLWALGSNSSGWNMRLEPATGTITVLSDGAAGHQVSVLVDANAPVLRVAAAGRGDNKPYDVTASLEIYAPAANWRRNETRSYGQLYASAAASRAPNPRPRTAVHRCAPLRPRSPTASALRGWLTLHVCACSAGDHFNASTGNPTGMGSFCFDRFLEPDTVVPAGQLSRGGGPTSKDSVVWYHRNEDPMAAHGTPSYYENVMRTQGLDPSAFPDPLLHRTFGGAMSGGGFARKDDTTLVAKQVSGAGGAVLEVVLATVEACADEATWLGGGGGGCDRGCAGDSGAEGGGAPADLGGALGPLLSRHQPKLARHQSQRRRWRRAGRRCNEATGSGRSVVAAAA